MSSGWVEREVGRGRVHTLMWTRGASNGRRLQRVRRRLRLVREGGNSFLFLRGLASAIHALGP
jgi:hypothetical protein